ncbi:LOW QUALITY PROTEIN: DNA-binding protein RFX8 [Melopsittacus undulatus]|uniref:LOW QUALITY PROTEIN: DNA-binding protein RFX8 n=1 Tax=Melopsittacus undulatus TaxID=13146 RepID=UPI001469B256|nr:LOW QUALITY PROTEIN: DNA-binding protein RFX8 [Melopsittacus undulatus]
MSQGSPTSLLHLSIIHWIADNFYLCEGSTIPRWLLYELYVESCSPYFKCQVNSATFGKIIRLVFPGLGTRRLGTRGSTRYHYDGIAIKKDSSFYESYCALLSEKNCHSKNLHCSPFVIYPKTEQERFQYLWPESSRFCLWEQQELAKKYPYETVVLLANEYYSHCQVILHMVRTRELDKVEGCIMSFWKSLPPGKIALMSLPDVCQLLESYDRQLFKEMENILLHDFLEEVPLQHIKAIRLFSKNVELWMVNALECFPLQLQTSKSKEVTVFIKRLRRKTDLANMVKTMRTVLNSHSKVTVLRSDLHAIIEQRFLDIPGNLVQKAFRSPEEPQNDIELKCLNDLVSLLTPSTDIRVLLNCVSSNLHAFVIQPSRNKEEFRELASDFHLRWNFLLRTISKALTLNNTDSFGSWHLLNLLLMDFVAHIFLSYTEEKEYESFWVAKQNELPVLWHYEPSYLWGYFAEEQHQVNTLQPALTTSMPSQNNFGENHVFQSSEMFGGHSHWQQGEINTNFKENNKKKGGGEDQLGGISGSL